MKRPKDHQIQILHTFSKKHSMKMSLSKKYAHSLFDCNGCLKDKTLKGKVGLFLVESVAYKENSKKLVYWMVRY